MTDNPNRVFSGAVNQSPGMNEREGVATALEIANGVAFAARMAIRSAKGPRERSKAIGAEEAALQIVKAISVAPAPSAWQPIETAPKDGTEILVTREGNGLLTRIVKWAPEPSEDCDAEPTDLTWRIVDRPMACMRNSTHWMPVPSLPSSDRGGVGVHRTTESEDAPIGQAAVKDAAPLGASHLVRLVEAVKRIVDRHAETKEGSGVLSIPVAPHEMKNLRQAIEPFRSMARDAEIESRPLASTLASGGLAAELDATFNIFLCAKGSAEKHQAENELRQRLWDNKAGIIARLRASATGLPDDR